VATPSMSYCCVAAEHGLRIPLLSRQQPADKESELHQKGLSREGSVFLLLAARFRRKEDRFLTRQKQPHDRKLRIMAARRENAAPDAPCPFFQGVDIKRQNPLPTGAASFRKNRVFQMDAGGNKRNWQTNWKQKNFRVMAGSQIEHRHDHGVPPQSIAALKEYFLRPFPGTGVPP